MNQHRVAPLVTQALTQLRTISSCIHFDSESRSSRQPYWPIAAQPSLHQHLNTYHFEAVLTDTTLSFPIAPCQRGTRCHARNLQCHVQRQRRIISLISSHSNRVTAAVALSQTGISGDDIAQHPRWKPELVASTSAKVRGTSANTPPTPSPEHSVHSCTLTLMHSPTTI